MWILHILDYHHWHRAKTTSHRKKHRRVKHAICCGHPKTVSFDHFKDEVQNYLDADAVPLLDERQTVQATPTDGVSSKARIKALIAKEMSARSRFQRTDSVLHSGPTNGLHPIIILQKSTDTSASGLLVPSLPKFHEERVAFSGNYNEACLKQNSLSAKQEFPSEKGDKSVTASLDRNFSDASRQLHRENSCRQFVECVDVLELFKINKKLFLEILQDPDAEAAKKFHVQLPSDSRIRLNKSGSFPSAEPAQRSYLRPTTLEHKQKEIWSFPKGEKFPAGAAALKFVASKSSEDSHDESTGLKADNNGVVAVAQETDFSSSASSHGSNKHGWHQSFMSHLKDVMKKIKHTLKESKKENNRKSANVLLYGVPSRSKMPIDEKETPVVLNEGKLHQDGKENSTNFHDRSVSDNDPSKSKLPQIRRVSSLNESIDRYARLFEYSLTRETKSHGYQSRSLKLSNEDKFPPPGNSLKSFKRRLSLPDLDSLYPLPNDASDDPLHSGMPIKSIADDATNAENDNRDDLKSVSTRADSEQFETLDAIEEAHFIQESLVEVGHRCENNEYSGDRTISKEEIVKTEEPHEDAIVLEKQGCSSCQDQETSSIINSSKEHKNQSSVSVFETDFQEAITGQAELPVSKGSELVSSPINIDEPNSSLDQQDRSSSCISVDSKNYESAHSMVDCNFLHFQLNEVEENDFSYVKDVLDISGLFEQGCLGTWHSLDQPLSPTLFKELEAYLHHESERSSENFGFNCDHQLLFDLINEVLLHIHGSSLAYFPKPFSFTQLVHPSPKGIHILEEVWKRISWYRNSRTKADQSLDDIVIRDLSKDDSWRNLQIDVEDIALDLEDLIFDDLINEVVCS
ncbi:hypothetical protein JCGZ_05700 [Jatropha curcas]|uniref:DUF4378 domain-containing protein n=1 Tax=Jatropha curcas TaxID=180498 RepID=A0A067LAM0_JATCU|nr:uncharacterized protein LOC105628258 [Jatropha curcas]KDP44233.1 hypothetical protein JCGZ_05700 [Jatropha curcas]